MYFENDLVPFSLFVAAKVTKKTYKERVKRQKIIYFQVRCLFFIEQYLINIRFLYNFAP